MSLSVPCLDTLALRHGTDKGSAGHNYAPLYEQHFGSLRDKPVTLLEIGVQDGASLRMWRGWFGVATIIGVDIGPRVEIDGVETITANARSYDPGQPLDIVIDDGSHAALDISAAQRILWPWLNPGGWYVVEDIESHNRSAVDELGRRPDIAEEYHYPEIAFFRRAA